jgi:hypothetical protein
MREFLLPVQLTGSGHFTKPEPFIIIGLKIFGRYGRRSPGGNNLKFLEKAVAAFARPATTYRKEKRP